MEDYIGALWRLPKADMIAKHGCYLIAAVAMHRTACISIGPLQAVPFSSNQFLHQK